MKGYIVKVEPFDYDTKKNRLPKGYILAAPEEIQLQYPMPSAFAWLNKYIFFL
jgi:hypothetical protein